MATVRRDATLLTVETDCLTASVATEGYISGVAAGSFMDKRTGARDLGFGLMIVDFLLEPGADTLDTPEEFRYRWGDLFHGNIPKRYVELPQICTQAGRLEHEITEGPGFVAVRQWFTWHQARPPYRPGSTWEQCLIFPDGVRWFLCHDRVTSVNDVEALILRMDMPGHIRHQRGDTFEEVYLSWAGSIPATAFSEDFPPDARYLYRRDESHIPPRFIKGYEIGGGPWLMGMCLEPAAVYESWCHQRGYVCMIH
ncbi:MAG: hypothetical protein N2512_00965, partial [Armatimonadetes bacterium]|nr:hypothetical protein [Armatimonadota bacterium]